MVLVDTSVWIEHLRAYDERLGAHLHRAEVIVHPFVVGEMALGGLRRRAEVIGLLSRMPQAPVASHAEMLTFIERRNLSGKGGRLCRCPSACVCIPRGNVLVDA